LINFKKDLVQVFLLWQYSIAIYSCATAQKCFSATNIHLAIVRTVAKHTVLIVKKIFCWYRLAYI